jgi:oxaloacetate decarboxylase gamma subunit
MSPDIQTAFSLLLIGMLSVFVILFLVVSAGRLLIYVVNTYFPNTADEGSLGIPKTIYKPRSINRKKLAAITAAVDQVTQGRGKIITIERQ